MSWQRWSLAIPFVLIGVACVIAGGFVAAGTALAPTEHGAWSSAYLVLVGGVAQVGLGLGQAWLAPRLPTRASAVAELALWNAGDAAVLAGTLTGLAPVVDVGGVALVAALALFIRGVGGATSSSPTRLRWTLYGFRALVLILLVSVPVGLVLADVR